MTMVRLENVSKVYRTPRGEVRALDGAVLEVREGEFLAVRGPSGSGKTTLLLTIGGMLRPTSGRVLVDGQDVYAMHKRARAALRAEKIGFVFQMYHLVPYLNVLENVLLPEGIGKRRSRVDEARELLDRLHLSDRAGHRPGELSAGERQRTAIARAMLVRPRLMLADEPTGNLDQANAHEIIDHLDAFRREGGTVIMVTHGMLADPRAHRTVHLREGRIQMPPEESS